MKKSKVIILVLILLGIILIIIRKIEIENYITFESITYESIDNVVFYDKKLEPNSTLKNNLTIIANQLKIKYPDRKILYLRNLGGAEHFNAKALYRCIQIENGQQLYNTDMNILIKKNGSIDIQFLVEPSWKNVKNEKNIEITQDQAKEIVKNYLFNTPSAYKELKNSFYSTDSEKCKIILYNYNSTPAWKMQFSTGNSYIIIDAISGKILDEYFFCGAIVD